MTFLRPEALAALARWREALFGVFFLLWGSYLVVTAFGIPRWIGGALAVAGLLLIFEGVRRARFPADGGGAGVLEVTERQITYLTPSGGAAVSLDTLVRIEIETSANGPFGPDFFWIFHANGQPALRVPGNAEGTDRLFDAFTALPGFDYAAVVSASGSVEPGLFPVWKKPARTLH